MVQPQPDSTMAITVVTVAIGLPRPGEIDCLFLDVDGVLNTWDETPLQTINEECGRRLDRLIAECAPLYVVLSSAWRKYGDLYRFMRTRFVIHDRTPTLARDGIRGDEIDDWLRRHRYATNHAILDDNVEGQFHPHQHVFHVDGQVGLTDGDVERVRAHFASGRLSA